MVPLSTGRNGMGRFASLKRAALALGMDFHRQYETTPLYLVLDGPAFQAMANNLLGAWRKRYLAPVVRTDAGVNSIYNANMAKNVEFLLSHPLIDRFEFVTPDRAVKLLS